MGLKLTYNQADSEKGTEFDLEGILVKNGESTSVTAEQEDRFAAMHGALIKDYFTDSNVVKVEGSSESKDAARIVKELSAATGTPVEEEAKEVAAPAHDSKEGGEN